METSGSALFSFSLLPRASHPRIFSGAFSQSRSLSDSRISSFAMKPSTQMGQWQRRYARPSFRWSHLCNARNEPRSIQSGYFGNGLRSPNSDSDSTVGCGCGFITVLKSAYCCHPRLIRGCGAFVDEIVNVSGLIVVLSFAQKLPMKGTPRKQPLIAFNDPKATAQFDLSVALWIDIEKARKCSDCFTAGKARLSVAIGRLRHFRLDSRRVSIRTQVARLEAR
jgi:hypothetical protein